MSRRSWLVGLLKSDAALTGLVGNRIYQAGGVTDANKVKPYLIYHIGNNTDEMLSETHPANRIFFQVYIHDEPGDYQQIDAIGDRVKELLRNAGSPEDHIMTTRFLERSQDLDDDTLRTIFQYLRFQWILDR